MFTKSNELRPRTLKIISEGPSNTSGAKVMGIHCRQGRSRSGILLACYLVHFHRFLPDQAINTIRMIRRGSCDFPEHEEAVGRYYQYLTEDNPLKFGVSGEVMEQFIDTARQYNKSLDIID